MITPSLAGAELLNLSTYSFHNNKTFIVDDTNGNDKGLKVMVKAIRRDEPAASPMYLSAGIQCAGQNKLSPVDLAFLLKRRYGDAVTEFLGKPTKSYPTGQIHVCSLVNVNFDETMVMVSVLRASSKGCDQSKETEFIFLTKELCP